MWATLLPSLVTVVVLLVSAPAAIRVRSLATLAPPAIVWVVYLASLGSYNNFHAGYAVLNQVMWLWSSTALIAVALEYLGRWPAWQRPAAVAVWAVSLAVGVGLITVLAQRTNYRALAAASLTPIDQYLGHVLNALPARARAWGSVDFGIEHPGRIQLVQFWDGVKVLEEVPAEPRRGLAPDYLVWGGVENAINAQATLAVNGMAQTTPDDRKGVASWRLFMAFADARYTLVSLTLGPPYGVTRVYAWTQGAPVLSRPMVQAYDPAERQWNSALGPIAEVPMVVEPPAHFTTAAGATPRAARQTLRGDLAPAQYLLTVSLASVMAPDVAAMVVVSGSRELPAETLRPAADRDIAPWFVGEPVVHLVFTHTGGPFYVSQFGSGLPAITGVQASALLPLSNYHEQRRAIAPESALPASQWTAAFPEIAVTTPASGVTAVVGNTTLYGYQAYGPRIPVHPGQRMRLRVPVTVTAGRGCLGVLDQTELRWLVAPDQLAPVYEFSINDSRTIKPVLADCSGSPAAVAQLRATIGDGSYALWSDRDELYVDQLMRAFSDAQRR